LIDIPVHPAAAVFPMLADDELRDLADDIKENGLHHSLVLDSDGRLVDGRNRSAACRMSGVEPTFISLPPDTDILKYILSENVRRRHMSQGQQAMAIALMIETDEGKRDGTAKRLISNSDIRQSRLSEALAFRRYAPDLGTGVVAGTESFDKAYEVARARKRDQDDDRAAGERKAREDGIELERLRGRAPDLAALVPDTMTVAEAKAALAQREERARGEREAKARVAAMACGWLDPGLKTTSRELAAQIVSTLDARALADRPDFSAARLARCAETLAEMVRLVGAREDGQP
jgi:ParB-like chromosome segregation protein Spo0J